MEIKNYEIDDLNDCDYPKYCDAFLSYAEDKDGNVLSGKQLDEWQEENPEKFRELLEEYIR
jgi:hypothetical protein|tara:strand:- start:171 stop:353 length:183 start_codon:yes stop_codon:yes gene_type:complete